MQRVAIIGSGGAGKSRLAMLIGQRTGLPVVHLDPVFWRPGWSPAAEEVARGELAAAIAGERWILDGNFLEAAGGAFDVRFERADTVLFLDLPRRVCLWQAVQRLLRDRGRTDRADLPAGCREQLDLGFLRWIWAYPRTTRPQVLELLARLEGRVVTHRLRSRADVRRFVEELAHHPGICRSAALDRDT